MIEIALEVKMQPGLAITDIPALTVLPDGKYAYARAALHAAISMFGTYCVKKELIPKVILEVPCPPLFNAFSKSVLSLNLNAQSLQGVSNVNEVLTHPEQLGKDNFKDGIIKVNDATACTVLHISQTRHYFLQAMRQLNEVKFARSFSGKQKDEECIHPKVISEINGLFNTWERWSPQKTLDLSKSQDVPRIQAGAGLKDLIHLVIEHDLELVTLLLIILSHEYGHLMINSDRNLRQGYYERCRFLLYGLEKSVGNEPSYAESCNLLQSNKNIFAAWQSEIAADMVALDFCSQILSNEKDTVYNALGILCLLLAIIEIYAKREYFGFSDSYPESSLRYILHLTYLTDYLGWPKEKSLLLGNEALSTLQKLKNHPAFQGK